MAGQGDNKYEKILPKGPATTEIRGVKVCMGQNFKLLLEGWCLQQSCRVVQGDNKYAKILNEGPALRPHEGSNTQKIRYRRAELRKVEASCCHGKNYDTAMLSMIGNKKM